MGNGGTGEQGNRITRIGGRQPASTLLNFFATGLLAVAVSLFPCSPVSLVLSAHTESARSERNNSTVVSTATREGRLAVFDDAWETINNRYYDKHFRDVDWDAQRKIFRPLAAEAKNSGELYVVLRRMIGTLNDRHTRIYPPEAKFDWWNPRFVSIGLRLGEVEALPTVVQVERGSAPQRAGILPGDVIESVNSKPSAALIAQSLLDPPLSAGSSKRSRAVAAMLEGAANTPVEISWQGKNGREKSAWFQRYWDQRQLSFRIHRERGKYAIMGMDAFTPAIALEFARAMKEKLRGVRGVILDLRSNGGGEAEAMADIASTFLGAEFSLGEFMDRSAVSYKITTRSRSPLAPELITQIRLPLIVLTSERTASAAEIFVAAVRAARRATIIGTETCGCVLAIRTPHTLPDGGALDVSELDYRTAAGVRLEGQGVKPDQVVTPTRRDLYAGRDRVVASALSHLEASR
jgi:carboxyl-terminal processing protease